MAASASSRVGFSPANRSGRTHAKVGVADDPNDVIPHENRRSLRGQFPIFAWLNHTDLQEDNTLDVFTADKFVMHYLIDFGKALGVMAYGLDWQTPGHTYRLDVGLAFENLVTFGARKRSWDGLRDPGLRGVGVYDADHYEPGEWRANSMYWPLEDQDRHDAFWGRKLPMRSHPNSSGNRHEAPSGTGQANNAHL